MDRGPRPWAAGRAPALVRLRSPGPSAPQRAGAPARAGGVCGRRSLRAAESGGGGSARPRHPRPSPGQTPSRVGSSPPLPPPRLPSSECFHPRQLRRRRTLRAGLPEQRRGPDRGDRRLHPGERLDRPGAGLSAACLRRSRAGLTRPALPAAAGCTSLSGGPAGWLQRQPPPPPPPGPSLARSLAPSLPPPAAPPRRSSDSPPESSRFPFASLSETREVEGGHQAAKEREARQVGPPAKCCFDTSSLWKLSKNIYILKNNSGRGLLRRRNPGERKPVGRPMVFRQRAGKFVEHFLGIRSFPPPSSS